MSRCDIVSRRMASETSTRAIATPTGDPFQFDGSWEQNVVLQVYVKMKILLKLAEASIERLVGGASAIRKRITARRESHLL